MSDTEEYQRKAGKLTARMEELILGIGRLEPSLGGARAKEMPCIPCPLTVALRLHAC